jgi:hypothetical protein
MRRLADLPTIKDVRVIRGCDLIAKRKFDDARAPVFGCFTEQTPAHT